MSLPSPFIESPETLQTLIDSIQQKHSLEDKYRQLIQWSMKLPKLPEQYQQDEHAVLGCENKVWYVSTQWTGKHYALMYSDSRIMRGLLYIIWIITNGKPPSALAIDDIVQVFANMGLSDQLSASKEDGLMRIVKQICA